MYFIYLNFPRLAAISSFTQRIRFESSITVAQARSIVDDRFTKFTLEVDKFLESEYELILT